MYSVILNYKRALEDGFPHFHISINDLGHSGQEIGCNVCSNSYTERTLVMRDDHINNIINIIDSAYNKKYDILLIDITGYEDKIIPNFDKFKHRDNSFSRLIYSIDKVEIRTLFSWGGMDRELSVMNEDDIEYLFDLIYENNLSKTIKIDNPELNDVIESLKKLFPKYD